MVVRNLITRKKVIITMFTAAIAGLAFGVGCQQSSNSSSSSAKYLYVASGVCESGTGMTEFTAATASRVIYRTNVNETNPLGWDGVVVDYNASTETAANNPGGIVSYDDNYFYSLVENATTTGARQVERVPKGLNQTLAKTKIFTDATNNGFGTAANLLRGVTVSADGTIFLGETTGVEGISTAVQRLSPSAAGYAVAATFNSAGNCGIAATASNISSITTMPPMGTQTRGKLIITNTLNTSARVIVMSPNTFTASTDCQGFISYNSATSISLGTTATEGGSAGGNTTVPAQTTPTAAVYIPGTTSGSGKLLVAVSTSTANTASQTTNAIIQYDVTDSGNVATGSVTFSNAKVLYNNDDVIFGVSAMAYDSENSSLFVATANSQAATVVGYNIEKFTYDSTNATLTRVTQAGGAPFQYANAMNKCVSSMMVSN